MLNTEGTVFFLNFTSNTILLSPFREVLQIKQKFVLICQDSASLKAFVSSRKKALTSCTTESWHWLLLINPQVRDSSTNQFKSEYHIKKVL